MATHCQLNCSASMYKLSSLICNYYGYAYKIEFYFMHMRLDFNIFGLTKILQKLSPLYLYINFDDIDTKFPIDHLIWRNGL